MKCIFADGFGLLGRGAFAVCGLWFACGAGFALLRKAGLPLAATARAGEAGVPVPPAALPRLFWLRD